MATLSPTVAHWRQISFRTLVSLALCSALTSCGGGGGGEAPVVASTDTAATVDLAIAEQAYSPDSRTPPGFYSEPRLYPDRSEFRFHVMNDEVGVQPGATQRFEVCSDDFAEALQWSSDSADARQFSTTLTATSESDWYFEFQRSVEASEPAMLINRVFKCSALDRAGLAPAGYAGQVTRTPLTAADVRFLSEYFWQFSVYNNALNAVIDSVPTRESDALVHELERVEIRRGAGLVSGCDRVELWTWRHRASLVDGVLDSSQIYRRGFDARRDNGVVRLCGQ